MTTVVHRCSFCGAPLPSPRERRVSCEYCAAENEIVSAAIEGEILARAVAASESIQAECDAKTAILTEKMTEAFGRGDKREALKYMEGVMRVAYAPTIRLYQGMGPGDPKVIAALAQIDDAIDHGMESTARSWGVEYVPVAARKVPS